MEFKTTEIAIPEYLVNKYIKDFDGLPGSAHRDSVLALRNSVLNVQHVFWENPEMIEDDEFKGDFAKAMAIRMAMMHLGIFFDA